MTDPMELVWRLERLSALEAGWYANVGKRTGEQCCAAMSEAAACIREMVEKREGLKRSVERYRDQVAVERKAYRNLLADYEGRALPPAPGAEDYV